MVKKRIIEYLKYCPILEGLHEDQVDLLSKIAFLKSFKKKEILYFQKEQIQFIYFLIKGKAKIYKSNLIGREYIIEIVKTGNVFPLEILFLNEDIMTNCEITEEAEIIMIPISFFKDIVLINEKLSIDILNCLSDKLIDLDEELTNKLFFSVEDQILSMLLKLGKNHGRYTSKNWVTLDIQFSKTDLAKMVGISRETMSRCLNVLVQNHSLKYNEDQHLMIYVDKIQQLIHTNVLEFKGNK